MDLAQEPVIMTSSFINNLITSRIAIEEDLNFYEFQKLVVMGSLEKSLVLSISAANQNLLNMAFLWRFSLITKLDLADNLIKDIDSIENLPNLQVLDLSFNSIKIIKGLTGLNNLLSLNLSFNEISVLENMDDSMKLETFFVRHNKLESLENINYLRQFKNLLSLGIGENPLMKNNKIQFKIIAMLPQLKFLDFDMVPGDKKEMPFNKDVHKSKASPPNTENDTSLWMKDIPDKEAFVDGLANGQGFETFLRSDRNFLLLHSYPPASSIAGNHRKRMDEVFNKWHHLGHSYYKEMKEHKNEFSSKVKEAHNFTLHIVEDEEFNFITFKQEIPTKFCQIHQTPISDQRDKKLLDLKETCTTELTKTQKNMMNASCLCIDLVYQLGETFESEIDTITSDYLQSVQNICKNIMEVDETYISQLLDFYSRMFDRRTDFNLEMSDDSVELDPVFLLLLSSKGHIDMVLKMSPPIHCTLLQERIKSLETSLHKYKTDALNQALKIDLLFTQKEQVTNAVLFCNKQRYIIEEFFSVSLH